MTNKDLMFIKREMHQRKNESISKEILNKELLLKAQKTKSEVIKADCYWCLSKISVDNDENLSFLYLSAKHGGLEASISLLDLLCGLNDLTIKDLKKAIKKSLLKGIEFSNPMEYLKYNGYEHMNILIVLAYFALIVDKDEQKSLDYMYDFASFYSQDIIEGDSDGLYNSYGFQYYHIVFEDEEHFIWNKTKILFDLLKNNQNLNDDIKFTYAVFLYGAICSIYDKDDKIQINEALDIIKDLCGKNQKDAIKFVNLMSTYSLE